MKEEEGHAEEKAGRGEAGELETILLVPSSHKLGSGGRLALALGGPLLWVSEDLPPCRYAIPTRIWLISSGRLCRTVIPFTSRSSSPTWTRPRRHGDGGQLSTRTALPLDLCFWALGGHGRADSGLKMGKADRHSALNSNHRQGGPHVWVHLRARRLKQSHHKE